MIEPHPDHGPQVAGQLHLVLRVCRADPRLEMVVRVGGALPEGDRRGDHGIRHRHQDRRGRVIEIARIAEVIGKLPAHFHACQKRVPDASRRP